jgi:hypothetical protein
VFLHLGGDAIHIRFASAVNETLVVGGVNRAGGWLNLPGEERIKGSITAVDSIRVVADIGLIECAAAIGLESL